MNFSSSSNQDTVDRLAEEFAARPRRVGRRGLAESFGLEVAFGGRAGARAFGLERCLGSPFKKADWRRFFRSSHLDFHAHRDEHHHADAD